MNRADFMKNLAELLADMSPSEREEAIQYYNDYFDDAGAENEQRSFESEPAAAGNRRRRNLAAE